MKSPFSLVLIACAIGHSAPALSQVGADTLGGQNEQPAEWRLTGARRAAPTGPGHLKEVEGVLVSDVVGQEIRFEASGPDGFVVPYDRINALHYEESKYPQRFLRRSSFYLTVHYSDADGRPVFETIRLLSERPALSAIATLERDTGSTFDRSLATRSFLGISIRAGVGARVGITDQMGQTTKGVISHVSASFLTLDESTGVERVFGETSLREIRLLYSPKHDALVGLAVGATVGASGVYFSAGLSGCFSETSQKSDCHVLRAAAAAAGVGGGLGALIGMTIGALRYPFNHAFDVYRGDVRNASRRPSITIGPQISRERKGAFVSVVF